MGIEQGAKGSQLEQKGAGGSHMIEQGTRVSQLE